MKTNLKPQSFIKNVFEQDYIVRLWNLFTLYVNTPKILCILNATSEYKY